MSDHDWLADPTWPRIVTEAEWRPGLPPPIEALQSRFRPENGWEVSYGTYGERSEDGSENASCGLARSELSVPYTGAPCDRRSLLPRCLPLPPPPLADVEGRPADGEADIKPHRRRRSLDPQHHRPRARRGVVRDRCRHRTVTVMPFLL
jgi:hypothetical protein